MTVQELHIELDLFVQQMNSSAYRKIRPEEKDRMLNEAMYMFIDSVFDERADVKQLGLEGNSRRLVDIKDLIVRGKQIPLYKSTSETTYGVLPPNYFYPVNAQVGVIEAVLPEIEMAVSGKSIVKMPKENVETGFYKHLSVKRNGIDLFRVSKDIPYLAEGLDEYEERFVLIDLMLEHLNRTTDMDVYWEHYRGEYRPNSFIFISGNTKTGHHEIQICTEDETCNAYPFQNTTHEVYKGGLIQNKRTRLIQSEFIYDVLDHSLSRTIIDNPVCTIEGDEITAYHDGSFYTSHLLLDYVRKPRKINLALDHGCEIKSESAQHRIVRLAGKQILRNLEAGSYQSAAQENILSQ